MRLSSACVWAHAKQWTRPTTQKDAPTASLLDLHPSQPSSVPVGSRGACSSMAERPRLLPHGSAKFPQALVRRPNFARRPRPCCSSSWKASAKRGELREVVAGRAQVSAGCVAAFCVVLALRQSDSVGKQKEVWRRVVEAE